MNKVFFPVLHGFEALKAVLGLRGGLGLAFGVLGLRAFGHVLLSIGSSVRLGLRVSASRVRRIEKVWGGRG